MNEVTITCSRPEMLSNFKAWYDDNGKLTQISVDVLPMPDDSEEKETPNE